jgi:DNA segregation ATPase FtsK/SpoIIIE-like protein
MLVHIVDVAGSEGRDPIEDFEKINLELERFNPELAERPQIVAANKIDLATEEQRERFRSYIEEKGYRYFEMCAPIVEGTKEVIDAVAAMLSTLPPVKRYESEEMPLETLLAKQNTGFEIFVEDDDSDNENVDLFGNPAIGDDPLYDQALEIVVQAGKASASYIQRRLKIGYNRAARLVEEMEERGIVGPANGSKPREIIHIP